MNGVVDMKNFLGQSTALNFNHFLHFVFFLRFTRVSGKNIVLKLVQITQMQPVPGHLISTFLKEKFEEFLETLRLSLVIEMRKDFSKTSSLINKQEQWLKWVDRASNKSSGGIGKKVLEKAVEYQVGEFC